MMDIKIFQEKLEQILAQAREQDKTLSGQDIREVFGEELSASQMQSLLEYLRLQGIRLDVTQSLAGDGRMFEAAAEKTAGGQGQGAAGQQESCGEKADAPATDPLSSEEEEYLRDYEASLAGIPAETERERESLWVRYDSGGRHRVRPSDRAVFA